MFTTYQEIEAKQIIPALRRGLAMALKDMGIPQHRIASLLHMTEGAISQYLMKKRGGEVDFSEEMKKEISRAAKKIAKGGSPIKKMQELIRYIEKNTLVCGVCRNQNKGISPGCKICF